jgi:hypothetical protein
VVLVLHKVAQQLRAAVTTYVKLHSIYLSLAMCAFTCKFYISYSSTTTENWYLCLVELAMAPAYK